MSKRKPVAQWATAAQVLGAQGGRESARRLTPEQRRARSAHAAKARWAKKVKPAA